MDDRLTDWGEGDTVVVGNGYVHWTALNPFFYDGSAWVLESQQTGREMVFERDKIRKWEPRPNRMAG